MTSNKNDTSEIQSEKRRRQMAILKASNQMLKEARETAMKKVTDPIQKSDLSSRFDTALEENRLKAKNLLHATDEEVENVSFRDADKNEVRKYNDYLQKRGITDEEMHRKEVATVTTVNKNEKKENIQRRKRRGAKSNTEDITRVENEDEIMKATMVKDDNDIEENKKKNIEYEQNLIKKQHNSFEKAKEDIKKAEDLGKVKLKDPFENERVEIKDNEKEEGKLLKKENNQGKRGNNEVVTTHHSEEIVKYDFDFGSIPSWVQYDVIPLPSNGQCYPKGSPLRCGHVPVAYLTASDENIIASPNMYRDGKLLDIILSRKILDKRIDVSTLSSGDRDAIILWLRATSYGDDFPISTTDTSTGKQYNVTIKLSQFKFLDFVLKGDENGTFDYETSNGDKIKFRFFTNDDEKELRKAITDQLSESNKIDALRTVNDLSKVLADMQFTDEERGMLNEDIDEINDIIGTDIKDVTEEMYPATITEQMIRHTVSIKGNEDRDYIRKYVENMRSREAMDYRNYFINNKPGVDFTFTVNIPESDGGGSFDSFLRIDDTIFINF